MHMHRMQTPLVRYLSDCLNNLPLFISLTSQPPPKPPRRSALCNASCASNGKPDIGHISSLAQTLNRDSRFAYSYAWGSSRCPIINAPPCVHQHRLTRDAQSISRSCRPKSDLSFYYVQTIDAAPHPRLGAATSDEPQLPTIETPLTSFLSRLPSPHCLFSIHWFKT